MRLAVQTVTFHPSQRSESVSGLQPPYWQKHNFTLYQSYHTYYSQGAVQQLSFIFLSALLCDNSRQTEYTFLKLHFLSYNISVSTVVGGLL